MDSPVPTSKPSQAVVSAAPSASPSASQSAPPSIGQTAGASAGTSGGLAWETVPTTAPLMHGVFAVPNGYLGVCDPSGEQVGQACTSSDGVKWSLTPDPAIFVNEGGTPFRARFAAHGSSGWVATDNGFIGFVESPAYAEIWHSGDGIHWKLAPHAPILKGLVAGELYAVGADLYLIGAANGLEVLLRSQDGISWVPAPAGTVEPLCRDQNGGAFFGATYSPGKRAGSPDLFSTDGRNWKPIKRSDSLTDFSSLVKLPDGTFLATSWDSRVQKSVMLHSADGVNWEDMSPTPVAIDTLVVFAGKLLGTANDSSGNGVMWASGDGGQSWQVLTSKDGIAMGSGQLVVAGQSLLLTSGGAQFAVISVGRPQ